MLSLWCSKKEFMTAPGLPCCSRDRSGYLGPSNMAPPVDIPCLPIPSPTLRRGGYQGQSPWLVRALRLTVLARHLEVWSDSVVRFWSSRTPASSSSADIRYDNHVVGIGPGHEVAALQPAARGA